MIPWSLLGPTGFLVLSGSSDECEEREREILTAFLGRRVDGLIVVPTGGSHSFLEREQAAGVQLVFADRPAIGISADTVLIDNAAGAFTGVRHLSRHGHRRIGYLGDDPGIYTAVERLRGYRLAVATLGLESDEGLVRQGLHDAAVAEEQALADLVDPPVTVIAQDADALGRRAAERLFGRLAGESGPPTTEVLPTQLIARGSGEVEA